MMLSCKLPLGLFLGLLLLLLGFLGPEWRFSVPHPGHTTVFEMRIYKISIVEHDKVYLLTLNWLSKAEALFSNSNHDFSNLIQ
jgi:hypothetical protein